MTMTSKEALETLFDLVCEKEHTNSEHSFYLKTYNSVLKDLEILEILNKYLKWNVYTASYTTSMNSKPKNYIHIDFTVKEISNEEKELLKEYLKNE